MAVKKYELDSGSVTNIKISAAKFAVSNNAEPSAAVTAGLPSASLSANKRSIGIHPRYVNLVRTVTAGSGATAATQIFRAKLPILTKAAFTGTSFTKGTSVTYSGTSWTVDSLTPEREV